MAGLSSLGVIPDCKLPAFLALISFVCTFLVTGIGSKATLPPLYCYMGYEYNYYLKKNFEKWFLAVASSFILYPYHHLFNHHFWMFLLSLVLFFSFASHIILAVCLGHSLRHECTESVHLKAEKGLKLRPVCLQVE